MSRCSSRPRAVAGDQLGCGHFHDTRGLGMANVFAAWQAGVARFDALPGRHRRMPACARRERQRRDRGRRLSVRQHGRRHRPSTSTADCAARASPDGSTARRCTERCGAPDCRRRSTARAALTAASRHDDAGVPLPLAGLRVVEFTHMVMGPTCGMVLADMGAEVIKVEPIDGDRTRRLLGAGAGFFPMFNRNKKSIAHRPAAAARAPRWRASSSPAPTSWPRTSSRARWSKYGLDYASLAAAQSAAHLRRATRASCPGPYDHRTALDEVVQMMGGLAYMTGRPGDPLRAGTSVNDIMGGLFGAIGALGALIQRGITGKGMEVQSALFENNVFLMGQHMLQFAVTGKHPAPMPARDNPWAVYDVFTVQDGGQIFLAAVSDAQWQTFCDALGFADLKADPRLRPTTSACARGRRCCRAARAPRATKRRRARRAFEKRRTAVRADPQARGSVRRSAPATPPAASPTCGCPTATRAGETVKTTLFPITMGGAGSACASIRRGSASTARIAGATGLSADDDRRARRARCRGVNDAAEKPPCRRSE